MAGAPTPRMHGATHAPGGPDPIPGIGGGDGVKFDTFPQEGGYLQVTTTDASGGITLESLGATGQIQLQSNGGIQLFTVDGKEIWIEGGNIQINADQGYIHMWAEGPGNGVTVEAIDGDATLFGGGDTYVYADGNVKMPNLPATDPAVPDAVWADDGTLVLSGHTAGGGGGSGGPPTGPAGGVLSGSYPNPGFAADMATQTELDTGLNSKVDRDAVAAATARLVAVKLAAGDVQPAFRILGDGKHEWGQGGSTAPDVNLYRAGADTLKTDDYLLVGQRISAADGTAGAVEIGMIYAGTPAIRFGTYPGDTNLYRSAAGTLQTDNKLVAGQGTVYFGGTDAYIYKIGAGRLGMTVSGIDRQVEVGPPDSGGAGYRMLRMAN